MAYYSGWLQKTDPSFNNITSITDEDKGGFMSCFHGMDFTKGLDLIIHSQGGGVSATESLIHYIRSQFQRDVRVFVPQIAMSGGTLLALSGREIWMGTHSNLGPIDPQFGRIPAVTLLQEFRTAYEEIKAEPARMHVWAPILSQIIPTLLTQAQQAIELSEEIAVAALKSGMLFGLENADERARLIAKELTNVATHKEHGRHIHRDDCERINLTIKHLEADQALQDAVLSVHHSFMITLSNTAAAKIIENHIGTAFVKQVQQKLLIQP